MLNPFSHEEFSEFIFHLKVDVTASCQALRRGGGMPIFGREEERCGPRRVEDSTPCVDSSVLTFAA